MTRSPLVSPAQHPSGRGEPGLNSACLGSGGLGAAFGSGVRLAATAGEIAASLMT